MSALLTAMAVVAVSAQNIDPTVEVSREYQGKLIEVHKPVLSMMVPDTLHNFDLTFDYSVFDNPYRGSYEFNPYMMEMRPGTSQSRKPRLYLRAGAGYTLHPTADILWSPMQNGPFSVDVYGMHRSYVGAYRAMEQTPGWNGYDLLTKAGADFGYDWKKASLDFGASYYGIADKDYRRVRTYNALDVYASVNSKSVWPKNFMYAFDMSYRFAGDKAGYASVSGLNEHNFELDVTCGPNFGVNSKMLFDLVVELDAYEGALASTAGYFSFVPHYIYEKGILDLDLGIRVSAVMSSGGTFATKGQIVYPDIHLNLALIPDAMKFFVHVGGGDKLNTYSSLLERNHHLDIGYGPDGYASLMNVTVERVFTALGFEGRISRCFSYNVRGGYSNYKSALLDGAVALNEDMYVPCVGYSPYQKLFTALDWNLDLQGFRFDGTVEYNHSWGVPADWLVLPSAFVGDVAFMYDWNKRVFAGIDCNFASSRTSSSGFSAPGYADLGVSAEYSMNRRLSFWLRGGNLLNMEIQRNLLYAEKGINFTAGICLNL